MSEVSETSPSVIEKTTSHQCCNRKDEEPKNFPCMRRKQPFRLKQVRTFLSAYVRFIQSPYRQDSILKTVQYTLWFLSNFFTRSESSRRVAKNLIKLQSEISWARYLLRFFELPGAILTVDSTKNDWSTRDTSKRLGQIMSWTMSVYYPLENLSYLFWKAPGIRWLPIALPEVASMELSDTCPNSERDRNVRGYSSGQLASKLSAWSCRFWLAWIILDIAKSTLALRKAQQLEATNDEPHNDEIIARSQRLRIVRNILYVLPAVTWSLPKWDSQPLLSNDVVNGFCWVESVIGLYQGIATFQQSS